MMLQDEIRDPVMIFIADIYYGVGSEPMEESDEFRSEFANSDAAVSFQLLIDKIREVTKEDERLLRHLKGYILHVDITTRKFSEFNEFLLEYMLKSTNGTDNHVWLTYHHLLCFRFLVKSQIDSFQKHRDCETCFINDLFSFAKENSSFLAHLARIFFPKEYDDKYKWIEYINTNCTELIERDVDKYVAILRTLFTNDILKRIYMALNDARKRIFCMNDENLLNFYLGKRNDFVKFLTEYIEDINLPVLYSTFDEEVKDK